VQPREKRERAGHITLQQGRGGRTERREPEAVGWICGGIREKRGWVVREVCFTGKDTRFLKGASPEAADSGIR